MIRQLIVVRTATLLMETALAFLCFAELPLGKFTGKDYNVTEKIYNDNVASQDEGNDCCMTCLPYPCNVCAGYIKAESMSCKRTYRHRIYS